MLKFALLVLPMALVAAQQRPKHIDITATELVPIADIPHSCDSPPQHGYGIVNGTLEKCSRFLSESSEPNIVDAEYETFKCKNLRLHGEIVGGKCQCQEKWKGPLCNDYVGCPDGHTLREGSCSKNTCYHDGTLAVGSLRVECRCNVPWDGEWCQRLACFRSGPKDKERRWRNVNNDHCECVDGFSGPNCETITKCLNGELSGNRCNCAEGWKGDLCERKCIVGQTCGANAMSWSIAALMIPLLVGVLFNCV